MKPEKLTPRYNHLRIARDFRAAQASLGLSNLQMAEAILMSLRSVEEMRGGRRPVTARTQNIIDMLLEER